MSELHYMINTQLIYRGIKDKNVINAFKNVPRDLFVDVEMKPFAYHDTPLNIGDDQTISQPYIVALMSESLVIKKTDKILEIGTGCGYQTAILAFLCDEVHSIERIERLHIKAQENLKFFKFKHVNLVLGNGLNGLKKHAPFDKIIVTAATHTLPEKLVNQLKENGKMVIPLGSSHYQTLTLVEKKNKKIKTTSLCGCRFVPLID